MLAAPENNRILVLYSALFAALGDKRPGTMAQQWNTTPSYQTDDNNGRIGRASVDVLKDTWKGKQLTLEFNNMVKPLLQLKTIIIARLVFSVAN